MSTAVQQVPAGALSPKRTHGAIVGEWQKAGRIYKAKKELATTPIAGLPIDKNQKTILQSQIGAELNVDQKGIAALRHTSIQIRQQMKLAGKALPKEKQYLYTAQADAAEATADFLETFAKGKSLDQAFGKKN